MASLAEPRAPYPGLRPFLQSEVDLFFGRDGDVDEILNRLKTNRFVAVLGASGSGKSSLVRTGVLEALELGLLRKAGSSWRFVDLRPGGRPIANLARALLASRAAGKMDPAEGSEKVDPEEAESLATMLQRGPRSIIEWSHAALEFGGASGPRNNLLILVDQFEELFGYDTYAKQEQAQAFVNLLIESANEPSLPIYVVLTMRSEYLGACALIDGLAEAINRGQYLTPRLSREQCRLAIEEPARVCGVEIEGALTNRLLNDLAAFAPWNEIEVRPSEGKESGNLAGTAQLDRLARRADQLPLMQHVLNRLWTQAIDRGETPPNLELQDYNTSGGLRGTLSGHADEVLDKLVAAHGEAIRPVAETVFRALINGASVADAVRRRTSIGKLVELSGGRRNEVLAVVEAYRAPRCNFLTTEREELDKESLVDISHESLIRQWKKLREWVEAEAATAAWWRRLREDAVEWDRLSKDPARQAEASEQLLRDIELTRALELQAAYRPSRAWTEQYGGGHATVAKYLDASVKAHNARLADVGREKVWRRRLWRAVIGTGGTLALVLIGTSVAIIAWQQVSDRLKKLQLDTAHTAIDSTLSTAMAVQSAGDWTGAGTVITAVAGPLLVVDERLQTNLQGLKPELHQALDAALQRQRANFRAIENIQTLGEPRYARQSRQSTLESRSERDPPKLAYYGQNDGPRGVGKTALANLVDNSIEVYATDEKDTWSSSRSVNLTLLSGPTSSKTVKVSSIALYGDGAQLAIVSGDVLYFGGLDEYAADSVRPVRIRRDVDPAAPLRGSRELEGTYAESSFNTLIACHGTEPRFLALDVDDAAWLVIAQPTGVRARRLFKGRQPRAYAVDPGNNLYAVVLENRVHVGQCQGEGDAEPVELPLKMDKGVLDIDFTAPGLLGIAGQARQVRFVPLDNSGRPTGRDEPVVLPPNTEFLRFAYDHRMWLVPGDRPMRALPRGGRQEVDRRASDLPHDSGVTELWDASSKRIEAIAVTPPAAHSPDQKLLGRLGNSHWLAYESNGTLIVQKPVERSPLPLPELAAAVVTIGGDVTPPDVEKATNGAFELLQSSGVAVRMVLPFTGTARDCERRLERLVDEIERSDGDIRAGRVLEFAQQIDAGCQGRPLSDRDEGGLLTWLVKEITDNSDITAIPFDAIRQRAAVLAARNHPTGLRLLAVGFDDDRGGSAALALRQVAAQIGRQLPYPLLDQARRSPSDRIVAEIAAWRHASADGRDDEIRALSHLGRDEHAEALLRLCAAQRSYLEGGDYQSAAAVGRRRREAAAKLSDKALADLWRRMHAVPTPAAAKQGPGPAPAASSDALTRTPMSLHVALETLASRLPDAIARSELLIEAANVAETDEQKIALLMLAVDAATSQRATRLQDTPKLADAARQLVNLGAFRQASAVIAEHLARMDARGDLRDDAVVRITDALRVAIDARAWNEPESRTRLAEMTWGFINFRWSDGIDNRRRALLATALELQEALVAADGDKTAPTRMQARTLKLAQARTQFWLGVFANRSDDDDARQIRAARFAKSVALFDDVLREQQTHEIRLQQAEAMRWRTSFLPQETLEDLHAAATMGERTLALYEALLKDVDSRPRDDYIRTATVSGLSAMLRSQASNNTEIAREEAALDNMEAVRRAALAVMRQVYRQAALFDLGRYADIKSNNPSTRNLCCLAAESQAEDAWMVGLLAAEATLARADLPAPTACEKLAAHSFDPMRRAPGVRPEVEAIAACEREAKETLDPARTAFLLGRAYVVAERREEALKQLAHAASGNYAQAFYNLMLTLSEKSRTCSVVPALLDRYRYLVLRDHLQPALQSLRGLLLPEDEPVVMRLRNLAKQEPAETTLLPKLGDLLPLTFLKRQCE